MKVIENMKLMFKTKIFWTKITNDFKHFTN